MKHKYRIGIDLDGVIWDLQTYWINEYNEITGENIKPDDIKTYNIANYIKYPELLWHILENGQIWDKIELYPDVYDTINMLKTLNHIVEFKIVTSTYYKIAPKKINRLLKLLPMLDRSDVIITDDKSWVDLDCLIDDYESNLIKQPVLNKILINQPYNRWVDCWWGKRANNLTDAIRIYLRGIEENECKNY